MTTVKIKTKGQFFEQIGEVTKILNQHQVMVSFPNIEGTYLFAHRDVEIVDLPQETDCNALLLEIANELRGRSANLAKYPTDTALAKISAYTEVIQLLKSKMS